MLIMPQSINNFKFSAIDKCSFFIFFTKVMITTLYFKTILFMEKDESKVD